MPTDNTNEIRIINKGEVKIIRVIELENNYITILVSNEATTGNVLFLKNLRKIFRKSHYCVACKVCQANCKFGNLSFDENGKVSISDNCTRCGQCLDIDTGCLVYKSLWLSKGLGNMDKKEHWTAMQRMVQKWSGSRNLSNLETTLIKTTVWVVPKNRCSIAF